MLPASLPAGEASAAAQDAVADLLRRASEAEHAGELGKAVMLLFHAAGSLDALAAGSFAEDADNLRAQAAACRARAQGLQADAAAAKRLAEEQAVAQHAAQRPAPAAVVAAAGAALAFCAAGPVTAVVAAVSGVAIMRRKDGLGEAVRNTGGFLADRVADVRLFDREHQLSVKASEAAAAARARLEKAEDGLKQSHPAVAATLGTAARAGGWALRMSPVGLAASSASTLAARGQQAAGHAAYAANLATKGAAVCDNVASAGAAVMSAVAAGTVAVVSGVQSIGKATQGATEDTVLPGVTEGVEPPCTSLT